MSNGDSATDVVSAGDRAVKEPASRATGYGDRATGAAVRVAEAPRSKAKRNAHVEKMEKMFRQLFPKETKVKVQGFKDAPSKYIKKDATREVPTGAASQKNAAIWAAWTNSGTEFFVNEIYEGSGVPDELFTQVILHEYNHIVQFRSKGEPKTYREMVVYEQEAYSADLSRAERLPAGSPGRQDLIEGAKRELNRFGEFVGLIDSQPKDKRESYTREQMINRTLLPPDAPATPGPLYR